MLPAVGPILTLAGGAVVALLLTPFFSARRGPAAAFGALVAILAAAQGFGLPAGASLGVVALSLVACVALLLIPTFELEVDEHAAEALALLLLGTAGAIALATAGDLVQAVIGLETLALSAVTLVALGRGPLALEAAFKYFVLGAISLATLLFGLGLVYLGAGSFAFPSSAQLTGNALVATGTVLVALGFAFELAVVPFHWGAVDAYTASAPALAGYVMSASKLAAALALGKLAVAAGAPVQQVLVWIGTLTIAWGTFAAIAQRDVRRMLAYSAITHAGFIALAAGSGERGPATAAFYAATYGSMAILTFAALAGRGTGSLRYGDVAAEGLSRPRAAALALGLLSLSGIPPTPGFWAKLAVLVVAWQAAGVLPTLVAVAGGVFAVLYYLRPLPDLFATLRAGAPPVGARPRAAIGPALALAAVAVLALAVAPNLAWSLAG